MHSLRPLSWVVPCLLVPTIGVWLFASGITARKAVPSAISVVPAYAMGDVGPNHYVQIALEGSSPAKLWYRMPDDPV